MRVGKKKEEKLTIVDSYKKLKRWYDDTPGS